MITDPKLADQFYAHNIDKFDLSGFLDSPIHFRPKWLTCWALTHLIHFPLAPSLCLTDDSRYLLRLDEPYAPFYGHSILDVLIQALNTL